MDLLGSCKRVGTHPEALERKFQKTKAAPPEGPCTHLADTVAPEYLDRDYFEFRV